MTVNVARSDEEAQRQARGEDVTMIREEALQIETFSEDQAFEEGARRGTGEQPDVE